MPIISLFGPDGSGKSTLTKVLASNLRRRGLRVRTSWMRGGHTLVYILGLVISKVDNSSKSINPHNRTPEHICKSRVWRSLEFVSAIPIILVRYILPSLFGFWVVAERYVPDFIVWLALVDEDERLVHDFISRFLLDLAKRVNLSIYVKANVTDLVLRRPNEDPYFIGKQLRLYEKLMISLKAEVLNTSRYSIQSSLKRINEMIAL